MIRHPRTSNSLIAALLLCSGLNCVPPDATIRQEPADGEELPILSQVNRTHSHETRAMQLVIRSEAAMAKVPLEEIDVDFSRNMLLIITLGRVPSDQYQVRINRVVRRGGKLVVDATVVLPPDGAPLAPASPYCIAVVPQSELNVERFTPDPPTRERTWSQSEPGFGGL